MATAKLTIKRGGRTADIVVAAGSAISGSDAIELNIDTTAMSKGDALAAIDVLKRRVLEAKWPIPTA